MVITTLTHRRRHWNLRLWFIFCRNPVPSVDGTLNIRVSALGIPIIGIPREKWDFTFPISQGKILKIPWEKFHFLKSHLVWNWGLNTAFVNRVKDRRNSEIIHVMEYLSNPDFVKTCKTDSFGAKVDAKKIEDKIITLIKRLYPESLSNYTESSGVQSHRMDDDQ